jgi:GTPase SAR1 family protein
MHNNYYYLYYFFDNPIIRWLRVFIFLGIGVLVYLNISNTAFVMRILPIYFVLILQEFFIHFKLENSPPQRTVHDAVSHIIETVDYRTRAHLERCPRVEDVMGNLLHSSEVKYLNRLLGHSYKRGDIVIDEEKVLLKAGQLSKAVGGKNIHGIDIYCAYLLLEDEIDKSLFQSEISEKDIVVVLSWVRRQYSIDMPKHHGLHFTGSGVFDFFVYGWSAELAQYALDFTKEVLSSPQTLTIGRAREYDLLVTALSKSSSSNAMLVGDAGVGKTALVRELAIDSNNGTLPKSASNKLIFKLYPERLIAGINNEGDLEGRIVNLFSELFHAGNIIVYIPNIENIFGGGGLNVDFSGALVEYLKSNRIKIIGSTTKEAYKTFIYPKTEIKELFDEIEIDEPDNETVLFMLLEKSKEIESANDVVITYSAIREARKLSSSYVNDGTGLPGRAVRLLEDVVSYCLTHGVKQIDKQSVSDYIEAKTQIILSEPTEEEANELMHMEEQIHKRVVAQDEAVKAISDAMRRVRSGIRLDRVEIVQAQAAGVPIISNTKLFLDEAKGVVVGVTGTKGKGTTSQLLFNIVSSARDTVFLGGNIGQSPLKFLPQLNDQSITILELSSFQLADVTKSPQLSVVLMVTSEHLDYHKTVEEYVEAKAAGETININQFTSKIKIGTNLGLQRLGINFR